MAPPQYIIDMDVRATERDNNLPALFGKAQFYVIRKEHLSDSFWTTNQTPYTITGEVTRICFTNNTPSAYFKVTNGDNSVPTGK